MRRPALVLPLALLALAGCGGGEPTDQAEPPPADPASSEDGVAAAQPDEDAAPRALALDTPTPLAVPAPPGFTLEVAAAGEYQIDATGSPLDPEMFLYDGDTLLESDNDGGERFNARVVRFLEPGTYAIRVVEHQARPMTAQVTARRLAPLEPVGTVTLGESIAVELPRFPPLRRPRNDRDASRAVALEITEDGAYTCTASATQGRDPKMALIQDGQLLEEDDDSGPGSRDSQITRALTAGSYRVRVWDLIHRGDTTITVRCARADAEE